MPNRIILLLSAAFVTTAFDWSPLHGVKHPNP